MTHPDSLYDTRYCKYRNISLSPPIQHQHDIIFIRLFLKDLSGKIINMISIKTVLEGFVFYGVMNYRIFKDLQDKIRCFACFEKVCCMIGS